jgi:SAM-dependent methyltransferase
MKHLAFAPSPALLQEIRLHPEAFDEPALLASFQERFPDRAAFLQHMRDNPFYADLLLVFPRSAGSEKILDVGCGSGFTAVYLAAMGYRVTAVEPVVSGCRQTELLAGHLGLSLEVYHGTAEVISSIGEVFDLVLFHSSLHHCDDPLLALRNAQARLRPQGRIWLLCENILSRLRTKKWFHDTLERHPKRLGHYGGNEHVYRVNEYIGLLNAAGFRESRSRISPMAFQRPRFFEGATGYTRLTTSAMHGFFRLARALHLLPLVKGLCDAASLGPRLFTAVKPRP